MVAPRGARSALEGAVEQSFAWKDGSELKKRAVHSTALSQSDDRSVARTNPGRSRVLDFDITSALSAGLTPLAFHRLGSQASFGNIRGFYATPVMQVGTRLRFLVCFFTDALSTSPALLTPVASSRNSIQSRFNGSQPEGSLP